MIDPWSPTTKESYWQRATSPPQCCHTASPCLEVDGIWPIKTFHLVYSQAQIGHHHPIWVAETVNLKRKCHTCLILCHITWRYLYSLCMNYLSSGHLCKLVHKRHQCQSHTTHCFTWTSLLVDIRALSPHCEAQIKCIAYDLSRFNFCFWWLHNYGLTMHRQPHLFQNI